MVIPHSPESLKDRQWYSFLRFLWVGFLLIVCASCQTQSIEKPAIEIVYSATDNDTATGLDETKIYKLEKQSIHSNFDYATLDDIDGSTDGLLKGKSIQSLFEPVRGEYTYFQCIATFKGSAYNGDEAPLLRDFHDILIIKTDEHNKIIDAYQYTLEWAEPPLQYDLYRSSVQGLTLTDGMDISALKFVRADYGSIDNNLLQETGIIQISKRRLRMSR